MLVAQEYLGAAELTAAKFVEVGSDGRSQGLAEEVSRWLEPGRWFRTGDLGRWHGDGLTASVVTAPTLARHEEKQMGDEEEGLRHRPSKRGTRDECWEVPLELLGGLTAIVFVDFVHGTGSRLRSRSSSPGPPERAPPAPRSKA